MFSRGMVAALAGLSFCVAAEASGRDPRSALLASPGLEGRPVKGVYFFPGEATGNVDLYTSHPLMDYDKHWNSDPSAAAIVLRNILSTHANTIVMSYWSNMPQFSPMELLDSATGAARSRSLSILINEARNQREFFSFAIIPAIEVGFDASKPYLSHWEFSKEFPYAPDLPSVASGLILRIGWLLDVFKENMDLWGQLYDRNGEPRFAVQLLHACSELPFVTDEAFASGFASVDAELRRYYPNYKFGFLLDTIGQCRYSPNPNTAGPLLEKQPSVLAVNGFEAEVFSGLIQKGQPCPAKLAEMNWRHCPPAYNNNEIIRRFGQTIDLLGNLAEWKRNAAREWVQSGLPVILDVSNGFDGRGVWATIGGAFWGDSMDCLPREQGGSRGVCTEDRWRNYVSEMKGGGVKGLTFDTWNGYTEHYAATTTFEHQDVVYRWLTDLLEPDPRDCNHMHYVGGYATYRVYGAICEKWVQLGGDRLFGAPVSNETDTEGKHGKVSHFADGKSIYWKDDPSVGAHEVHGIIEQTYRAVHTDLSCLGLPTSDELPLGPTGARYSLFEHGAIYWFPGDISGRLACS